MRAERHSLEHRAPSRASQPRATSIGAITAPNWNAVWGGRYVRHIINDRLRHLLEEPHLAIVGTTRRDGSVQINPLWYDAEGERFRFNTSDRTHHWVRHLQRDKRATVFVNDPADQYRWASFQCRFVGLTSDGGAEHVESLARRYTGKPYRWPRGPEARWVVTIAAYRVTGRDGSGGWVR